MKLVYAIVRKEAGNAVIEDLTQHGFSVTKMSTSGGFLRSGNTTLIVGTQDELVSQAIEVIKESCGEHKKIVYNGGPIAGVDGAYMNYPVTVDVGGATIFVLNVDHFEKI